MGEVFFHSLDRFGGRMALITESGDTFTYSELLSGANNLSSAIESRSVIFQVCRNDAESIAAYVGFLRRGAVPLLINDSINDEAYLNLKDLYHPSYVFLPDDSSLEVDSSAHGLGGYRLVKTEFERDYDINPELALLLTTSGSTGSPKLVRQSYRNISSNTSSIVEYLNILSGDRAITTLPMSYTFGLSIINTHLYAGAALILTNRTLMEREFWNSLRSGKATTFGGVPYTYEMLKKLRFWRMETPSLRYLTQAGGKLVPEMCAEFIDICRDRGMRFIVMYGQTEATARMSYLPWESARSKPGSIGVAIPGGEFSLKGDDGSIIDEPGVTGELIYKGDNVTLGYAENRFDLARGDERGGTLETGDMAYSDEDGFYYVVGRKRRFLKVFGNRVNLDDIERLLKKTGADCACGGVDDALKIYAVSDDIAALKRYVARRTGISPAGFSVVKANEIPRSSSGKVLYSELEGGRINVSV
ncbi:MAG: AMP-binding protein [Synergistaceae bacterium]|jgi:acyl-CoA synthetase (AMP-forming)/AMP-acid ligase II|nr:AMP-binding protein [Synergistaceae bacterium]